MYATLGVLRSDYGHATISKSLSSNEAGYSQFCPSHTVIVADLAHDHRISNDTRILLYHPRSFLFI